MLRHTPLFPLHQQLNARFVPFAGYEMPVQYPTGILNEHRHTRSAAGLFDVSHMGQIVLTGPKAAAALETLTPTDVVGMTPGQQRYVLLTSETGGVLDDAMVCHAGDHWRLVVNAANKINDLNHLRETIGDQCQLTYLEDWALLALQGPTAVQMACQLNPALAALTFMTGGWFEMAHCRVFVTRSGYTGEDGLEISVANEDAVKLAEALLALPDVKPVGLGARDSLRLEAGLCLHGADLDLTLSPIEAGLSWAIGKARRPGGEREGGFIGAERILAHLKNGVTRQRKGFVVEGKALVRSGTELQDATGKIVGRVTSGGFSPQRGEPIAMALIEKSAVNQTLTASVRGKSVVLQPTKMPFVSPRYAR